MSSHSHTKTTISSIPLHTQDIESDEEETTLPSPPHLHIPTKVSVSAAVTGDTQHRNFISKLNFIEFNLQITVWNLLSEAATHHHKGKLKEAQEETYAAIKRLAGIRSALRRLNQLAVGNHLTLGEAKRAIAELTDLYQVYHISAYGLASALKISFRPVQYYTLSLLYYSPYHYGSHKESETTHF